MLDNGEGSEISGRKWIYVLNDTNRSVNACKIGFAKNFGKRLSSYRTHNSVEPEVSFLQSCRGSEVEKIETFIKSQLSTSNLHGEWFEVSPKEAIAVVRLALNTFNQPEYSCRSKDGKWAVIWVAPGRLSMKSDYRQFHATITSKPAQNNYEYYEIEYLGELALDSYLSKHQSFDGAFNYIEQIVAEIWSEFID